MQRLSQVLRSFYYYFYIFGLKSLPSDSSPSRPLRLLHGVNRAAWALVVVVVVGVVYRLSQPETSQHRIYINVLVNFVNFSVSFVALQRSEDKLKLLISSQSHQVLTPCQGSKLRVSFVAASIPIVVGVFLATARNAIFLKHNVTMGLLKISTFSNWCLFVLSLALQLTDEMYQLLVSIFPYACITFVFLTNVHLKQKLDDAQKRVRMAKSPLAAHRRFNDAMHVCLQVFETNATMNTIFSKVLFCVFYSQILLISMMLKTLNFDSFEEFLKAVRQVLPLASTPSFLVFLACLCSSHEVNQKVAKALTSLDKSLLNNPNTLLPTELSVQRVNQLIFITTTRHIYSGLTIGGYLDIDGYTILEFLLLSWDVVNVINSKH